MLLKWGATLEEVLGDVEKLWPVLNNNNGRGRVRQAHTDGGKARWGPGGPLQGAQPPQAQVQPQVPGQSGASSAKNGKEKEVTDAAGAPSRRKNRPPKRIREAAGVGAKSSK